MRSHQGLGPEHVTRTRMYFRSADDFEDVARAHGEVFGEIRPATAAVVVAALVDPRWLVEIEADAVVSARLADRSLARWVAQGTAATA